MADVATTAHDDIQPSKNSNPMTEEQLIEATTYLKNTSWMGYFFTILLEERKRVSMFTFIFCIISFTYALLRLFKNRVVYSVLDIQILKVGLNYLLL